MDRPRQKNGRTVEYARLIRWYRCENGRCRARVNANNVVDVVEMP
jgi:hypothetical protein